jgi:hypothetical protein
VTCFSTLHGQHAQIYPPTSLTGPRNPQHGPYLGIPGDCQQHSPEYSGNSQADDFMAMMGSRGPQYFLAPPRPCRDPFTTMQSCPPNTQPAYSQAQLEPLTERSVAYGWSTGPARGPRNSLPTSFYQRSDQTQHAMDRLVPPYNMPQARHGSLQPSSVRDVWPDVHCLADNIFQRAAATPGHQSPSEC